MQHTDAEWHLYWNAVARKHEERKEAMENEQLEFDFVNDSTLPSGTEHPESGGEDARNAPSGNADSYDGGWFGIVPPRHGKGTFETATRTTCPPHDQPTPPMGYEIVDPEKEPFAKIEREWILLGPDGWESARSAAGYRIDWWLDENWIAVARPIKESDQAQETVGYVTFSEQEICERTNTTFIDIPDGDGFVSVPLAEFLSGDSRKSEFEIAAEQIGRLVTEKNRAYGNSFVDSAKILAILYPDGIPLHAYEDVGVIIRVCDKLKRIATDNDPFGEDPWEDIAGYGIIAHVRRTHKRRTATMLARREDEHGGTDDCSG